MRIRPHSVSRRWKDIPEGISTLFKFEGMETLSVIGAKYDCLVLRFKDGVKLYVPVYQMVIDILI